MYTHAQGFYFCFEKMCYDTWWQGSIQCWCDVDKDSFVGFCYKCNKKLKQGDKYIKELWNLKIPHSFCELCFIDLK